MSEAGRVLVVDDNRINRMTLARAVEREGHRVLSAADGEEALALLRQEAVDVVLLDLVMPGLDGQEVLRTMKQDGALRSIPVIVVSAVDEMETVVRCIELGAEDYLTKPFNATLLRARLRASLQEKRLRDLERAYLQQELMLRQSEKLATLGRLSAGMAHELNNPAAAAQRGSRQLEETLGRLHAAYLALAELQLSAAQRQAVGQLAARLDRPVGQDRQGLDPLTRSRREEAVEAALRARQVAEAWGHAPTLVRLGLNAEGLDELLEPFAQGQAGRVVVWFTAYARARRLVTEIHHGAGRIAELVKALKTYAYMDRAPVQAVNVHEGLENTLIILRSRLKEGVTVARAYAEDLPPITAYGSELNQVWTNLIDNAVDAMDGRGTLTLRTARDGDHVVVEVEDTGPGIPEELQGQIFDPFFTTKEPGQGTGLGLNIVHNIVTRHDGTITVTSKPDRTCFAVRLPVAGPAAAPAAPVEGESEPREAPPKSP